MVSQTPALRGEVKVLCTVAGRQTLDAGHPAAAAYKRRCYMHAIGLAAPWRRMRGTSQWCPSHQAAVSPVQRANAGAVLDAVAQLHRGCRQ